MAIAEADIRSPISESPTDPPPHVGIQAIVVPDDARLDFLPRVFGFRHIAVGEAAVYNWMQALCPSYDGGFWDFIDLSNGGFYLRWHTDAPHVAISVDGNGYIGSMSPDAASIVATMFAINELLFAGAEHLDDAYYKLRDFALSHPESSSMLQALD